MTPPTLTFICELEGDALQALFNDGAVIAHLSALEAGVCLGLIDHSPERADIVRRLNQAGIPVVAWLLLPKDQGYWFNIDNAPQAAARYADFRDWTEEENLVWQSAAIDIEPDFEELQRLIRGQAKELLPIFLRRIFDAERALNGRLAYGALVRDMRTDGFMVESFQFPFIEDERQAGSTILQRLFGIVDIQTDREAFMLYSSYARPYGEAVLSSYAPAAGTVAVGSTGGGVDFEGADPLSWQELARDLRLAYRWHEHIYIFSLEGCVEQDYLARIGELDWEAPQVMPTAQIENINRLRVFLRGALWGLSHPFMTLATVAAAFIVLRRIRRLLSSA